MARAVRLWRASSALSLLLSLPIAAHALGPAQPFTPPQASARAADAASAVTAPPPSSRLAGVRLGTSPRALIDGVWIALGQPVRDARLVDVRAQEVVLLRTDGRSERLALFPDAQPSLSVSRIAGTDATAPVDALVAKRDLR